MKTSDSDCIKLKRSYSATLDALKSPLFRNSTIFAFLLMYRNLKSIHAFIHRQSVAPNLEKFFIAKELPHPHADSDCGLSETTKADLIISMT